MKKLALLLIAAGLMFTACDKDDPSKLDPQQVMFALGINYTATWCGPCGNWGAPLIHDIEATSPGKVVAITNHASGDPMHNATLYGEMTADRETGGGIPSFWVGDSKVSSGDAVSSTQALLANVPDAGMDYAVVRTGNTFDIDVQVKFFNDVTGDYYLSTYILESGIDGSTNAGAFKQNGVSNPDTYKHDFVIRSSATGNAYGEMITSGATANQTFDKNYSMNIDLTWTNDVYVVCILWKYDAASAAPTYKFVNAFYDKAKITEGTTE